MSTLLGSPSRSHRSLPGGHKEGWELDAIWEHPLYLFPFPAAEEVDPEQLGNPAQGNLVAVLQEAQRIYAEREREFGDEPVRQVEVPLMLSLIDERWADYLSTLEHLAEDPAPRLPLPNSGSARTRAAGRGGGHAEVGSAFGDTRAAGQRVAPAASTYAPISNGGTTLLLPLPEQAKWLRRRRTKAWSLYQPAETLCVLAAPG